MLIIQKKQNAVISYLDIERHFTLKVSYLFNQNARDWNKKIKYVKVWLYRQKNWNERPLW